MLHQRGTMKPKQSIWLNDFCLLEAQLKGEEPGHNQLWFNCDGDHSRLLLQETDRFLPLDSCAILDLTGVCEITL